MATSRVCMVGCVLSFLAALQGPTDAYVIIKMSDACAPLHVPRLRKQVVQLTATGGNSAARVILDVSKSDAAVPVICVIDVQAPSTHVLSLTLAHTSPAANNTLQLVDTKREGCPLGVFPVGDGSSKPSWSVDLCDQSLASSFLLTEMLSRQRVTLVWSPPHANSSLKLQATQIILTAVGRGIRMCNTRGQFPCWGRARYSLLCIAEELACDGHRNCPLAGDDEVPEYCSNTERRSPTSRARDTVFTRNLLPSLEVVGSELLKKISMKHLNVYGATTTGPTPVRTAKEKAQGADVDSLPAALAHYGPWGYLMLGMLICGAVLMLCGVWECCCRRPKTSTEMTAATTVFIINNGGQTGEDPPVVPGPPAYEELDQPPDYNLLFPMTKIDETQSQHHRVQILGEELPEGQQEQRPSPQTLP